MRLWLLILAGGAAFAQSPANSGGLPIKDDGTTLTVVDRNLKVGNSIIGSGMGILVPFGGMQLPSGAWKKSLWSHLGKGEIKLYACPANTRCFLFSTTCHNTTGDPITFLTGVNVEGTFWVTNTPVVLPAGESGLRSAAFVLEPGEAAAVESSASGMNCVVSTLEFPITVPFYTPRVTQFAKGDNTIYQCCAAGRTAGVMLAQGAFVNGISGDENMNYVNRSGKAASIRVNFVPNGMSPGLANQVFFAHSIADGVFHAPHMEYAFEKGDKLTINSSQAGRQMAWITIMEY
jgi:hypothetical protein